MSSFNCEHCGTAIIDTPRGYITSCEHHKAEDINMLRSKHLEGDCHCHAGKICTLCEPAVMEKLNNLAKDKEVAERLKERFQGRKPPSGWLDDILVGRD